MSRSKSFGEVGLLDRTKGLHESMPFGIPLSSQPARMAEHVFTLGYPHVGLLGKSLKHTDGSVSATTGLKGNLRSLQITVPVQRVRGSVVWICAE